MVGVAAPRGLLAQVEMPFPEPEPAEAPEAAASAHTPPQAAPSPHRTAAPFRFQTGADVRTLYGVPFWGGHFDVGIGGRIGADGQLRAYGLLGGFVGVDRTFFRLTDFSSGLLLQAHLLDHLYTGVALRLGAAGLHARSASPGAGSYEANVRVGYDVAPLGSEGAWFIEALAGRAYYGGRGAPGSVSVHFSFAGGVRL